MVAGQEMTMVNPQHDALVECALSEIDQLLNNFDPGGQMESAMTLLLQHRRTLLRIRNTSRRSIELAIVGETDRWAGDLVAAYKQLGGRAFHSTVYRTARILRQRAGRSWPTKAHETIRQTLQAHNIQSPQYRGGADLFRQVRPGLWRLKDYDPLKPENCINTLKSHPGSVQIYWAPR
jgi:hypothetical protein